MSVEIQSRSATATRLWALDAPTFTIPDTILMVGAPGNVVTIPAPAYLIEHARGLVLFDTSLVPEAATDADAVYGAGLVEMLGLKMTPAQRIDNQIKQLGFSLSDIKYVIPSHLHFDHSGGMKLFPNAQFIIMKDELRFAYWPDPAGAGFFRLQDLLDTRSYNWLELGEDFDVFGDGSLQLLHTPGHTPGESTLVVRLPHRTILLTGDTVHLRAALEGVIPMPYDSDTVASLNSIRRVKALRIALEAEIWISHDPEDWAQFAHAPTALD